MRIISYICDRCARPIEGDGPVIKFNFIKYMDKDFCESCVEEFVQPVMDTIHRTNKDEDEIIENPENAAPEKEEVKEIHANEQEIVDLAKTIDQGKFFALLRGHRTVDFIRVEFGITPDEVRALKSYWQEDFRKWMDEVRKQ